MAHASCKWKRIIGPGDTPGGPLRLMVLSPVVGTQTSKYRHTKPLAQELEMEFKEKTGQNTVISAGHGQTGVLTSNFLQVTISFFVLYLGFFLLVLVSAGIGEEVG